MNTRYEQRGRLWQAVLLLSAFCGAALGGDLTVEGNVNVVSNLTVQGAAAMQRLTVGAGNTVTNNAATSGGFAQGTNTLASGMAAHAEGYETIASGWGGAHAEGYGTEALGFMGSHAEGHATFANGPLGSHAEGFMTEARGACGSHAQGYMTVTFGGYGSFVGGGYARSMHDRTFVWSDGGQSGSNIVSSTTNNEFTVHAVNGIRLLGGPTTIEYVPPSGDLLMGVYTNRP